MSDAAYVQVARDIRAKIQTGTLRPGDQLPSFASLCEQYQVSNTVIRSAMIVLKSEGWIDGKQGKGVYVADPLPGTGPGGQVDRPT